MMDVLFWIVSLNYSCVYGDAKLFRKQFVSGGKKKKTKEKSAVPKHFIHWSKSEERRKEGR